MIKCRYIKCLKDVSQFLNIEGLVGVKSRGGSSPLNRISRKRRNTKGLKCPWYFLMRSFPVGKWVFFIPNSPKTRHKVKKG